MRTSAARASDLLWNSIRPEELFSAEKNNSKQFLSTNHNTRKVHLQLIPYFQSTKVFVINMGES